MWFDGFLRQGAIRDVDKLRGVDEPMTLLHDASHDGDLETVKMLCQEMGADVALQGGNRRWAAVHYACDGGHVDVIRFLLTGGGADVERRARHGLHPLHVGAHSLPVVRCLVEEFGADVDVAHDGITAFHWAAYHAAVPCMRYLLERGARLDADAYRDVVADYAVLAESADALRFLVEECGCDPLALEERHRRELMSTAARNSLEVLQYLVEERGMPLEGEEWSGVSLLGEAAAMGSMEVAEWLVQGHGVSAEALNVLEEADEDGRRPLHCAASFNELPMVQWLLEQCRVDVDAPDSRGWRALHHAVRGVRGSNLIILKWLVEEGGADVNAATYEADGRHTALHLAASRGAMDCARYLVEEADSDVLPENRDGERRSQTAAREGHDELAAFLRDAEEMAQMQKNPE